jgi:hypothetical protein
LRELEELTSGATPQWRRAMALRELAGGSSAAVLTMRNPDDRARTVTLPRGARTEPRQEGRPDTLAELERGIWYVDLTRITDPAFKAWVSKLATARGIVFDLRAILASARPRCAT